MTRSHPALSVLRPVLRVVLPVGVVLATVLAGVAPAIGTEPRVAIPVSAPVAAPAAAPALATAAPTSAHPFSAPVWLPLRKAAAITCVRSNCQGSGGDYHGYWAIDFIGDLGDPVYAAGAGVFHVGATNRTCSSTSAQTDGTWGWVDHGGGVVTKYTHLDALTVADGARVTPSTQIGRMGHWGDTAPCTTNYLHFEVREGGIKGTRVDPRSLAACTSRGRTEYPAAWGVSSFDSLVKGQSWTPASTSGCIPASWESTPAQPTLRATPGATSATLSWGTPPAGTKRVRIATQLWSPSVSAWNDSVYSSAAGTASSTTLASLTTGRTYRVWVAFENASGFSAWSNEARVVPTTVPSVPVSPRFLTWPKPEYVHFGWWKSVANGSPVTRYDVGYRCWTGSAWRPWTTRTTNASTYYYNVQGLSNQRSCQVRVRAVSAAGASAWAATKTIRR